MRVSVEDYLKSRQHKSLLILLSDHKLNRDEFKNFNHYGGYRKMEYTADDRAVFIEFECEHTPLLVSQCYFLSQTDKATYFPRSVTTVLPGCSIDHFLFLRHIPKMMTTASVINHLTHRCRLKIVQAYRPEKEGSNSSTMLIELEERSEQFLRGRLLHLEMTAYGQFYIIPPITELTNDSSIWSRRGCESCNLDRFAHAYKKDQEEKEGDRDNAWDCATPTESSLVFENKEKNAGYAAIKESLQRSTHERVPQPKCGQDASPTAPPPPPSHFIRMDRRGEYEERTERRRGGRVEEKGKYGKDTPSTELDRPRSLSLNHNRELERMDVRGGRKEETVKEVPRPPLKQTVSVERRGRGASKEKERRRGPSAPSDDNNWLPDETRSGGWRGEEEFGVGREEEEGDWIGRVERVESAPPCALSAERQKNMLWSSNARRPKTPPPPFDWPEVGEERARESAVHAKEMEERPLKVDWGRTSRRRRGQVENQDPNQDLYRSLSWGQKEDQKLKREEKRDLESTVRVEERVEKPLNVDWSVTSRVRRNQVVEYQDLDQIRLQEDWDRIRDRKHDQKPEPEEMRDLGLVPLSVWVKREEEMKKEEKKHVWTPTLNWHVSATVEIEGKEDDDRRFESGDYVPPNPTPTPRQEEEMREPSSLSGTESTAPGTTSNPGTAPGPSKSVFGRSSIRAPAFASFNRSVSRNSERREEVAVVEEKQLEASLQTTSIDIGEGDTVKEAAEVQPEEEEKERALTYRTPSLLTPQTEAKTIDREDHYSIPSSDSDSEEEESSLADTVVEMKEEEEGEEREVDRWLHRWSSRDIPREPVEYADSVEDYSNLGEGYSIQGGYGIEDLRIHGGEWMEYGEEEGGRERLSTIEEEMEGEEEEHDGWYCDASVWLSCEEEEEEEEEMDSDDIFTEEEEESGEEEGRLSGEGEEDEGGEEKEEGEDTPAEENETVPSGEEGEDTPEVDGEESVHTGEEVENEEEKEKTPSVEVVEDEEEIQTMEDGVQEEDEIAAKASNGKMVEEVEDIEKKEATEATQKEISLPSEEEEVEVQKGEDEEEVCEKEEDGTEEESNTYESCPVMVEEIEDEGVEEEEKNEEVEMEVEGEEDKEVVVKEQQQQRKMVEEVVEEERTQSSDAEEEQEVDSDDEVEGGEEEKSGKEVETEADEEEEEVVAECEVIVKSGVMEEEEEEVKEWIEESRKERDDSILEMIALDRLAIAKGEGGDDDFLHEVSAVEGLWEEEGEDLPLYSNIPDEEKAIEEVEQEGDVPTAVEAASEEESNGDEEEESDQEEQLDDLDSDDEHVYDSSGDLFLDAESAPVMESEDVYLSSEDLHNVLDTSAITVVEKEGSESEVLSEGEGKDEDIPVREVDRGETGRGDAPVVTEGSEEEEEELIDNIEHTVALYESPIDIAASTVSLPQTPEATVSPPQSPIDIVEPTVSLPQPSVDALEATVLEKATVSQQSIDNHRDDSLDWRGSEYHEWLTRVEEERRGREKRALLSSLSSSPSDDETEPVPLPSTLGGCSWGRGVEMEEVPPIPEHMMAFLNGNVEELGKNDTLKILNGEISSLALE